MGTVQHNAVIATTFDKESYDKVIDWVSTLNDDDKQLFVSAKSNVNGYITIILTPDGSKERRPHSDHGDALRNSFIERLNNHGWWKWIEVGYGELGQGIIRGNCE